MAMRLYKRDEFYEELCKRGFQETAEKTETHTVWIDPSGNPISVPHCFDVIPDHILDRLLEIADRLYTQACVHQHHYNVKEKKDADVIDISKSKRAEKE